MQIPNRSCRASVNATGAAGPGWLLFLSALFWLLPGCGTAPEPVTTERPAAGSTQPWSGPLPPPVLLISLDGFRHDYFALQDAPNLARLRADGLQAQALIPVYPSKTFTNHYSVVTGLYAEDHGVVANRMWDPQRQRSFRPGDAAAVGDAAWFDGEPIWVTAQRQGLRSATYFWPGSEAPIGGVRPDYWVAFDERVPNRRRVQQVLAWLDLPLAERPSLLTLYFGDVDTAGHRFGPDSPQVAAAIRALDEALGELLTGLEARGLLAQMHLLITSDHGMAALDPERVIYLEDYLAPAALRISDLGASAHLWAEELSVAEILAALEGAHPHIQVWRRETVPARLRFSRHRRIPDVVVEADPGWEISDRRRSLATRVLPSLQGGHGWDPAYPDMQGIFIGHGPAFVPGSQMPAVELVHLYVLMCHLLGIRPAPQAGDLQQFAPYLQSAWQPGADRLRLSGDDAPPAAGLHAPGSGNPGRSWTETAGSTQ